jgi:hypothetical protein
VLLSTRVSVTTIRVTRLLLFFSALKPSRLAGTNSYLFNKTQNIRDLCYSLSTSTLNADRVRKRSFGDKQKLSPMYIMCFCNRDSILMEDERFSETSIAIRQPTQCHFAEDISIQIYRRDYLNSCSVRTI